MPMFSFLLAVSLSLSAPSAPHRATIAVTAPFADSTKARIAELKGAIDSGIVMLRTEEYRGFLDRFLSPDQRADILGGEGGLDALVEMFKTEKAGLLLDVLKSISGSKPSFDKGKTLATFKLPKKSNGRGVIEFRRIDGVWYIRN
jgi:hypothetical protein